MSHPLSVHQMRTAKSAPACSAKCLLCLALLSFVGGSGCDSSSRHPQQIKPQILTAQFAELHLLSHEYRSGESSAGRFELDWAKLHADRFRILSKSCGCFEIRIDGKSLPVGEEFVANPGALSCELEMIPQASAASGISELSAVLELSGEGGVRRLPLRCRVAVHDDLEVDPIVFVRPETPSTASLELGFVFRHLGRGTAPCSRFNKEAQPPGIVDIKFSPVTITETKIDGVSQFTYRGTVKLDSAVLKSPSPPLIVELTKGDAEIVVIVPLSERSTQGLVGPTAITLGGEPTVRMVVVSSPDGRPFEITKVQSSVDWLNAAPRTRSSRASHVIQLTTTKSSSGRSVAAIDIDTDWHGGFRHSLAVASSTAVGQ